jgi:hypothetical protein
MNNEMHSPEVYDVNAVPPVGSSIEAFGAHLRVLTQGVEYHGRKLGWLRYLQGKVIANYADTRGLADDSDDVATFARQFADISGEYARKLAAAARSIMPEKAMSMTARELIGVETAEPKQSKQPKRPKKPDLSADGLMSGPLTDALNVGVTYDSVTAVRNLVEPWQEWTFARPDCPDMQRDYDKIETALDAIERIARTAKQRLIAACTPTVDSEAA